MMDNDASPGAVASAVNWIQNALTGEVASTIAVIAVASVGFLLLSGKLEMRRAIQVIFGCFVLFGASSIASGLMHVMVGTTGGVDAPVEALSRPDIRALPPAPQIQSSYDPYAGAAVPRRPR
jgi:type IV secretion system protein VirB2